MTTFDTKNQRSFFAAKLAAVTPIADVGEQFGISRQTFLGGRLLVQLNRKFCHTRIHLDVIRV